MELATDPFKSLNRDLVADIMSRLDGCTLASTASTCTHLKEAAEGESLWQNLCHNTWPSMSKGQLSLQKSGGFKSIYSDAYPLILYNTVKGGRVQKEIHRGNAFDTSSSPMEFISLVDIYYNAQCVFSKVVYGMAEGTYRTHYRVNLNRFLCYPFELDLLGFECPKDFGSTDENLINVPSTAFMEYEEIEDLCDQIIRDLRLSWILFDKRRGKAANISSWKPRSVQRSDPSDEGYYTVSFGCIIPTEDSITTQTCAECVITVKCKLMAKQGCIRWKEITFVIRDIDGSHLSGEESMAVVKQAIVCPRSVNHYMVELGYQKFHKEKIELKLRNEQDESLANILSAIIAIVAFLGVCYACVTLL